MLLLLVPRFSDLWLDRYGGIVEAFLMLEDRGALRPLPPPPAPPPHTATESIEHKDEASIGEGGNDGGPSSSALTEAGAHILGGVECGAGGVVASAPGDAGGAGGAAGEEGGVEDGGDGPRQQRRRWISEVRACVRGGAGGCMNDECMNGVCQMFLRASMVATAVTALLYH